MAGMTQEQMAARIAELEAANDALKAKRKLSLKVSEKTGALCVYGLGRFPLTLYRSQWEELLKFAPEIQAFIEKNKSVLASKK